MNLIVGKDLWEEEIGRASLILFTANSFVTKEGRLVMGRGAALEARKKFPGLDAILGARIRAAAYEGGVYGICYPHWKEMKPLAESLGVQRNFLVGAFQVKRHFRESAELEIIRYSISELVPIAERFRRVAFNFPGIGAGHLAQYEDEIQSAMERFLPDNVWVYRHAK